MKLIVRPQVHSDTTPHLISNASFHFPETHHSIRSNETRRYLSSGPHLIDAQLVIGSGFGATVEGSDGVEQLLLQPPDVLAFRHESREGGGPSPRRERGSASAGEEIVRGERDGEGVGYGAQWKWKGRPENWRSRWRKVKSPELSSAGGRSMGRRKRHLHSSVWTESGVGFYFECSASDDR